MLRRSLLVFFSLFLWGSLSVCFGQSRGTDYDIPFQYVGPSIPHIALKNNILLDATLSFNLSAEFRISRRYTLELGGSYNPWSFSGNKKWKHWLVQPEFRVWLCEPFSGHFFGVHPTYGEFNVGHVDLGALKEHRYDGSLLGGGFSYGYHWFLSPRWSIEASMGFGYLYMDYERHECARCGDFQKSTHRHYVGPTRAAVNLIYIIK